MGLKFNMAVLALFVCLATAQLSSAFTANESSTGTGDTKTELARGGKGTMDGGGGNGLVPRRYKPSDVKTIFSKNKDYVMFFFNRLQYNLMTNQQVYFEIPSAIGHKLFGENYSEINIQEKILNLKIDFLEDEESCRDRFAEAKNGSIYPKSKLHDFCISAFEVANKYSKRDITDQLLGLAIHEIGHLYGLDEADADFLQTLYVDYAEQVASDRAQSYLMIMSDLLPYVPSYFSKLSRTSDLSFHSCKLVSDSVEKGTHFIYTKKPETFSILFFEKGYLAIPLPVMQQIKMKYNLEQLKVQLMAMAAYCPYIPYTPRNYPVIKIYLEMNQEIAEASQKYSQIIPINF